MNSHSLTPALVTQKSVQRLPRLALFVLIAAYLLPGLFGRDPWGNADISAFGFMLNIARGWASPLSPAVGGVLADSGGLLPYWLGAAAIKFLPWLDPALAARLPFSLLLGGVLMLTWYSCYHLARTAAAQPLPLAFGGEAQPVDYGRAVADGSLLALVACLGLLEMGHETTPELMQLFGATLFMYALAASLTRPATAKLAVLGALPILAGSGSPTIACILGAAGVSISWRSEHAASRRFAPWVAGAAALAVLTAFLTQAWGWRLGAQVPWVSIFRSLSWFTWPAWPLAAWTLWRWRGYVLRRHITVPLALALVGLAGSVGMGGADRALLLALPGMAVLAAFALPTFKRSYASAIDWFSVCFFTACAIGMWVVYSAMQTGVPAKTAANVVKLAAADFKPEFSAPLLAIATGITLAWIIIVRWRTGRRQHALWTTLVIPAAGVVMCWTLMMTLWMPVMDHARSYRSQINRVARFLPHNGCVAAPGLSVSILTALQYFGGYQVDGRRLDDHDATPCQRLVLNVRARTTAPTLAGWEKVASERKRSANTDQLVVYRRAQSSSKQSERSATAGAVSRPTLPPEEAQTPTAP